MTTPDPAVRYEFSWLQTTGGDPVPSSFALGGISEDVAKGIRYGLRQVPSITGVTAARITENREAVAGTT